MWKKVVKAEPSLSQLVRDSSVLNKTIDAAALHVCSDEFGMP
jgi:hypothetical protein